MPTAFPILPADGCEIGEEGITMKGRFGQSSHNPQSGIDWTDMAAHEIGE
jgi:hypothetical protein